MPRIIAWHLKLSPIFTGLAAANDLDGKSDDEVRAVTNSNQQLAKGKQASDRTKVQAGRVTTGNGEWLGAPPLELPYATSSDGNSDAKITSPVLISLIDLESAGNTKRDPKQALHFGQCQT